MTSLLVIVFAVEVAVHIINLIGASVINNLVCLRRSNVTIAPASRNANHAPHPL